MAESLPEKSKSNDGCSTAEQVCQTVDLLERLFREIANCKRSWDDGNLLLQFYGGDGDAARVREWLEFNVSDASAKTYEQKVLSGYQHYKQDFKKIDQKFRAQMTGDEFDEALSDYWSDHAIRIAEYLLQLAAMIREQAITPLHKSKPSDPVVGNSGDIRVMGNTSTSADDETSESRILEKATWLAYAMLIVRDHPDWSDRKIANNVGRHSSQLSRSEEYQRATAMARGSKENRPRGRVTIDPEKGLRDIEAWDDQDITE